MGLKRDEKVNLGTSSLGWISAATALSFTLATASPAQAFDPSTVDWTGFYAGVGLTLNSARGMPDGTWEGTIDDIQIPQPTNYTGIGGIATIGAAIDAGTVVLGLDAQFDFGEPVTIGNGSDVSFDLAKFCDLTEGDDPNCAVAGISGTIDPLWRARAVIGTEIEPGFLVFAAGGVAAADVNLYTLFARTGVEGFGSASSVPPFSGGSFDPVYERLVGYTIGAGWQKRVTENFSLRGEVTHDNYGQFTTGPVGATVGLFTPAGNAQASIEVLDYVTITNTAGQISAIWHVN